MAESGETAGPGEYLPLHPLEFRILLAVLDGPRHGYAIVQAIEAREPEAVVYPANLYRRIRTLLGCGLLREAVPESTGRGDDRRRYVEVTALGRAVARAEAERLESLVRDARAAELLSGA